MPNWDIVHGGMANSNPLCKSRDDDYSKDQGNNKKLNEILISESYEWIKHPDKIGILKLL